MTVSEMVVAAKTEALADPIARRANWIIVSKASGEWITALTKRFDDQDERVVWVSLR